MARIAERARSMSIPISSIGIDVDYNERLLAALARDSNGRHHFVENARNILATRSDWNDHPPLGKLLLAIGIVALGERQALAFGFTLGAGFGTLLAWGATRLHRRVSDRIDRAFFEINSWIGVVMLAAVLVDLYVV